MNWLTKSVLPKIKAFVNKEETKQNLWIKCNSCDQMIFEKDLNKNFTQYYDLIYSYETDCISLNFSFNKSFYNDGSLEPNKSLSFLIKIIPFTELGVSNVGSIVKN